MKQINCSTMYHKWYGVMMEAKSRARQMIVVAVKEEDTSLGREAGKEQVYIRNREVAGTVTEPTSQRKWQAVASDWTNRAFYVV